MGSRTSSAATILELESVNKSSPNPGLEPRPKRPAPTWPPPHGVTAGRPARAGPRDPPPHALAPSGTALRFAATVQGSWLAHWWRLPPQLFEPVHDRLHFRFAGHSLRLLQHQEALPVRRRVPVPGAQLEQRPWLPGPTSTHL